MKTTLPTDSKVRKTYPLVDGLFGYFPAALCGVAHHSYVSNEQHNPGQPLHWSIDKSTDHANCVLRHVLDLQEMIAAIERAHAERGLDADDIEGIEKMLSEADAAAWRALALNQTLRMKYRGAPLPFNARRSVPEHVEADIAESAMLGVEGYPSPRCSLCMTQPCSCDPRSTGLR